MFFSGRGPGPLVHPVISAYDHRQRIKIHVDPQDSDTVSWFTAVLG